MTDTIEAVLDESAPSWPMRKAEGCPFDPPPQLRELQAESPISKVRIWNGATPWLITRAADVRRLLGDPRISSDSRHPEFPRLVPIVPEAAQRQLSFINMDEPDHSRLRRMVTGQFAIKRVEELRPSVQRIVDDLIDELLAGPKPVDLVKAFALPVPSLVICRLLGVPYADHDFFQTNSAILISRSPTAEEREEAFGRVGDYLDGLIEAKGDKPEDDLLSEIALRRKEGELTSQQATYTALLMLIADELDMLRLPDLLLS